VSQRGGGKKMLFKINECLLTFLFLFKMFNLGEKSHQSEHGKWVQQGSGKFDNRLPAPISIYD
jgi:hypothetical protein